MKNLMILFFLLPFVAGAQTTHTVKAKETLYSLARKYSVHPRELAAFNNIPVETSLTLGQVIRIPAKTTMPALTVPPPPVKTETEIKTEPVVKTVPPPAKTTPVTKQEGSYPIYHKVAKKETLYHISKSYPNLTIEDIKKWNKITGDGVAEGTNLIVGYSKTKNATVAKIDVPVKEPAVTEVKPVIVKPVEPEKKEAEKVVKTVPVKKEEVRSLNGKNFNGGAFKGLYTQQTSAKKEMAEEKGPAGIFKSASGWEDGKYYCLTNAAPAGTIVKVTNNATQKTVYAKVLDLIPDLKQNTGMVIRISNAAAEELGANNSSFECTLNF